MIGIGSTVGNYRVMKKLGSGAMGNVFLAEHPMIGKKVALKVIHSDLAENEEMVSRFFNEARAVTQIGHANIVEVIDFGQTPEGDNFIVMELLEGESLGDVLKRTPIMPLGDVKRIAIQIAEGLDASHSRGIIHRDLKPDNVYLITRAGRTDFVKILDFGLAKLTQGGGAMSHKTRAGSVLGTPHYMAPEQCEGRPDIDARVDVYALGCIMYQALCGRVPFPGDGFGEVLVKHLREPPQMPSKINAEIPRPIEAIILNCLAKRKEFRFQSMKAVAQALRDPNKWVRELEGDAPIRSTMEVPLSEVPELMDPEPPAQPARSAPVPKHDAHSATMLDELPSSVKQVARQPATLETAAPGLGGQATMLFDGQAPPPPPSASSSLDVPARNPLGKRLALAVGGLALVTGGAITTMKLQGPRDGAPKGAAGARVVKLLSDPPGAEVLRDDTRIGTAPLEIAFEPGTHTASIRVHHEGYVDVARIVDDTSGEVTVHLRAAAPTPSPPPAVPEPAPPVVAPAVAPAPAAAPPSAGPRKGGKGKKVKGKSGGDDILVPDF